MAVKYRIVSKKVSDMKGGAKVEKFYAQPVYGSKVSFERVCKRIAERSTATSADVKAVLDGLNYVLSDEMSQGNIVQMGELGNFRPSLSSVGADSADEFTVATNMKEGRIIFTPGKSLREAKASLSFELTNLVPGETDSTTEPDDGGGEEDDGPVVQ